MQQSKSSLAFLSLIDIGRRVMPPIPEDASMPSPSAQTPPARAADSRSQSSSRSAYASHGLPPAGKEVRMIGWEWCGG